MKQLSNFLASVFALVLLSAGGVAVSAQQSVSRSSRATTTVPTVSTISTLYSSDPIANRLCLTDGREGGVFQNGLALNRCSHIEFDTYKLGSLSVGVQGAELGAIVDLGTWRDFQTNQAFPCIRFVDGKIVLMRWDNGKFDELPQAAEVFGTAKGLASIEATTGHMYLARITDPHRKDFQILVKLLVLSVKPGESITFRWELL